jgi:hypothetical protein
MFSIFRRAGAARIAACLLPVALSACAGGSGPRENIVIDSEPQGARVLVAGQEVGVTPVSLVLDDVFPKHWTKRQSEDEQAFAIYRRLETVELKKDGCEPFKRVLAEGAMDREVVKFALKCDPNYKPAPAAAPSPAQPAASVEERLRTLDELKRKGLVTDEEYRVQRQRILGNL